MGLSARDVDDMSYWQLFATADGWANAHDVSHPGKLSEREADEIWEWMKTRPPVPASHHHNLKPNGANHGSARP